MSILGPAREFRVMSTRGESNERNGFDTDSIRSLIAVFRVLNLRDQCDPVDQILLKEQRSASVNAMLLTLAAASKPQNSAVISIGDQDSKTYAEQARLAKEAPEPERLGNRKSRLSRIDQIHNSVGANPRVILSKVRRVLIIFLATLVAV